MVDSVVIIPMVEIDPALSISSSLSSQMHAIRRNAPIIVSIVAIPTAFIVYVGMVVRSIRTAPTSVKTRRMILNAPRNLGSIVVTGWLLAYIVGFVFDIVSLSFASTGEAIAYYSVSAVAMVSTGLFGFLVTYAVTETTNRRIFIPLAFPDGGVSRNAPVRSVSFIERILSLWFGVGFFPLLVLGLGIFTRRYLPENEVRAFAFIAVFIPASFALVYRFGRSIQQPLRDLVGASRRIGAGHFDLEIKSRENDDIGFLTDATTEMAAALAEKEMITETFGRAVDPRVRDHLLSGNIELGGSRTEAAIMFCDIRGFTQYSETRSEEEVVRVLNEHLQAMERVVNTEGGMINKFLGDGVSSALRSPDSD
jgi:hypothetical protein